MPSFVADLQTEIDHVLFADLEVIRDLLAAGAFAPAALVEAELGVDHFALVLNQPLYAVEGTASLFVGRERDDDVAVRLEAFAAVTDEIRDPDRSLGLVVAGAAAVKVAIALDELERVHAPVFAFGFHNVGVRQKQERFAPAGAAIAGHQICFAWAGSADEDVGFGKAGGLQPGGCGFGYGGGLAGRVARLNLDELLIDVAS